MDNNEEIKRIRIEEILNALKEDALITINGEEI